MSPEHIILGCCLLEAQRVDECAAAGIGMDSFESWEARELWDILANARANNLAFDLDHIFLLPGVNGTDRSHDLKRFIFECSNAAPTSLFFAQSVDQVAKRTLLRRTRKAAMQVCEACESGEGVDEAMEALRLASAHQEAEPALPDIARAAIEDAYRSIQGHKPKGIFIEWPWPAFNKHALPIRQHEFVVLCARPSRGKSSIGMQVLSAAMMRGLHVLHFSLETSVMQCLRQMAGQIASVNLQQLDRDLPERTEKYVNTLESLGAAKNLKIIDRAMKLEDIEARCRLLRDTYKPQLVVIDYLQLIQSPGGCRYEQITNASNRLMALRKTMDCPFIILAQLSRAGEAENRAPQMSDLRDSGAIEQDASRIIAIHRPMDDFGGTPQMGENAMDRTLFDTYLMQLKHREGPVFNSRIKFHAPSTVFFEE